jgi:nucleoside-diphosphate-sugar epimerase
LESWYNIVIKGDIDMTSLIHGGGSWVDVRDLGLAHALALEKEAAGGERIIVTAGKSHRLSAYIYSKAY